VFIKAGREVGTLFPQQVLSLPKRTWGFIQIGSPESPGNYFHLCFWGSTNTCVYVKKFIDDLLGKPQIESRIKLVKAHYVNMKALVKAIPDWSTKVPDMAKELNSGVYNNDCLAYPEVREFFICCNFSSFYRKWYSLN
jgi:hypothetical protein